MIIDSETHFWKYQKNNGTGLVRKNKIFQENYLPEQLAGNLRRNGVDACVAVASEPAAVETRFLCELAETHPEIAGVVGWIDLKEQTAAEKIHELSSYTPIRGFRISLSAGARPAGSVMEALAEHGYSLDLSLQPDSNTETCSDWMRAFPEQAFILENGGSPDTRQAPAADWIRQISQLAENPNLYCKAAGLLMPENPKSWKPGEIYPFLDTLFESFGASRLLFASDWPFLLPAASYLQWKSLLEKYSERLSETEKEGFFGENARRIYRL